MESAGLGISEAPGLQSRRSWGPAIFVAAAWIVLFLGAWNFVARYGVNVPFAEDGMLIPYVTGQEPLTVDFLWSAYNAHRLPLSKLALVGVMRAAQGDFRAGLYLNVAGCAVIALILIAAARTVRGHLTYTDAFFPIALLHLGHWECFLIGFAFQFVLTVLFLAIILLIVLRSAPVLKRVDALVFGVALFLLPTTGMAGVLVVPPLATWLAYAGIRRWRTEVGGWRDGVAYGLLAFAALAFVAFYFLSSPGPHALLNGGRHPRGSTLRGISRGFLQILSQGFGNAASQPWLPFLHKERAWKLVGLGILGMTTVSIGLFIVAQRRPLERLRAQGLLAYLVAALSLVGGIAIGRANLESLFPLYGLAPRYALYAVPILWGLYLGWETYGSRRFGRFVPITLFSFMCAMFAQNMVGGRAEGEARHAALRAVERDVAAGDPMPTLIRNHSGNVVAGLWTVYWRIRGALYLAGQVNAPETFDQQTRTGMTKMLRMLKTARTGEFKALADDGVGDAFTWIAYETETGPNKKNKHATPLYAAEQKLGATFSVACDNIGGVEVLLSTYGRQNRGRVTLELQDSEARIVRRSTVDAVLLKDNSYHFFPFPVLEGVKGKQFRLRLTYTPHSAPSPDRAIAAWTYDDSQLGFDFCALCTYPSSRRETADASLSLSSDD